MKLVTFDVYSALVDVQAGISGAIREAYGGEVDAAGLARAWRAKQLEGAQLSNSLQKGRIPFRELTRLSMEYTFTRAGLGLGAASAARLMAAWDALPPWPEALGTLREIKARGYRIGVLSNGDEDMLRALLADWSVTMDHVLASDHAGAYKPHPAIYGLPATRLGLDRKDVLHVAGSGNDVLGAKRAGLACAWSNRTGDIVFDPAVHADHEMPDLSGLLEILPAARE